VTGFSPLLPSLIVLTGSVLTRTWWHMSDPHVVALCPDGYLERYEGRPRRPDSSLASRRGGVTGKGSRAVAENRTTRAG
jgi:hypothetical protein